MEKSQGSNSNVKKAIFYPRERVAVGAVCGASGCHSGQRGNRDHKYASDERNGSNDGRNNNNLGSSEGAAALFGLFN